MKNKLTEKDLNLIMSFVDGELNTTDQQKAKNLISSNSEAKKAYDDMKLSSNFFSGYVSDIASDSDKIKSNQKTNVNRENIFNVIFQNPFRNFVAYPIAAVFIFSLGFQVNNMQLLNFDNDTEQFRGIEQNEEIQNKIEELEEKIENLEDEVDQYKTEIDRLNKLLKEKNKLEQLKFLRY